MSPEELPAALAALKERARFAAVPAVNAMGVAYQRHLVKDTLRKYTHPPQTKTPSPPGEPPALVTGTLRRSVRLDPAKGSAGGVATASVAPHTVYARIQELGGVIRPVRAKFLRWVEDGVVYFRKKSVLPPRPYMRPARQATVADGSLHDAAKAAFARAVWGG